MDNPTTENPQEAPQVSSLSLLAQEHFGSEYVGEVAEETPEVTEPIEEEVEQVAEEAPAEEAEEVPAEETEEVPIGSFDELVESQEWDPEWLNTLRAKVKVDGEEKEVSFSDLRASYQMQEAAQKRLEESKQKAQAVNEELSQKQEQINQQYTIAAKMIEKAEAALSSDSEKVDWDRLKVEDPAEWSAKKLDMQERRQHLDSLKQEAIDELQTAQTQNQEERNKALAEAIQQEGQRLVQKIPEWADQALAKAEKDRVASYLKDAGFADEEIASAYDHRMVVMARKAMLYDEQEKKLEPAKKKYKKVIKTLPPGSKKTESQINHEQQKRLKGSLKKSGSIEDALAVLRAGN